MESKRITPLVVLADIKVRQPRHFQCIVCNYTFELRPCEHGLRGKDLNCPECNGKLKRIDSYECEEKCSPDDCEVCEKCE